MEEHFVVQSIQIKICFDHAMLIAYFSLSNLLKKKKIKLM